MKKVLVLIISVLFSLSLVSCRGLDRGTDSLSLHKPDEESDELLSMFSSEDYFFDYKCMAKSVKVFAWTFDGKEWKAEEILKVDGLEENNGYDGSLAIRIGENESEVVLKSFGGFNTKGPGYGIVEEESVRAFLPLDKSLKIEKGKDLYLFGAYGLDEEDGIAPDLLVQDFKSVKCKSALVYTVRFDD